MEERKEEIRNPTKNVHIYRTITRTSGRKEEREKSIADGLGCVINEQNEDSIEEEKKDDKKIQIIYFLCFLHFSFFARLEHLRDPQILMYIEIERSTEI
jgi:hypothetical protein